MFPEKTPRYRGWPMYTLIFWRSYLRIVAVDLLHQEPARTVEDLFIAYVSGEVTLVSRMTNCNVANYLVLGHVPRPRWKGLRLRLFASSTWMEQFYPHAESITLLSIFSHKTLSQNSRYYAKENEHCSSLYDRKIKERKMIKHGLTCNERKKRFQDASTACYSLVIFSQKNKIISLANTSFIQHFPYSRSLIHLLLLNKIYFNL